MATSETFNVAGNNETSSSSSSAQHSPWHSPVPYLFGGLAAMLGLIAFALLILACSYWKLSGYLEDAGENQTGRETDLEAGEKKPEKPMEEKVLVIMAGEMKPTYLATPVLSFNINSNNNSTASTSRSSSFGEINRTCTCVEENEKKESGEQVRRGSTGSLDESSDQ